MRWFWGLGSLLLLFGLAGQAAYLFRTDLSVSFPGARPLLAAYCGLLGGRVPLPKKPEAIGIESSGLQADPRGAGIIDLNASIRNSASYAVAYPLLELTLTDAQDAPLARKVFSPGEYLRGERIDEGIPANSATYVRLVLDAGSVQASGYRLYLFYP